MINRSGTSLYRGRASWLPHTFHKPSSLVPAQRQDPTPKGRESILSEYKKPYVIRPFVKDAHLDQLQYIEYSGMYRKELAIQRNKYPRFSKTVSINTDGSLSEREFEVAVPPLMVLFMDRGALHQFRVSQLAKTNRLDALKTKSWEKAERQSEFASKYDNPVCNALCFPYCVPSKTLTKRSVTYDPLDPRFKAEA